MGWSNTGLPRKVAEFSSRVVESSLGRGGAVELSWDEAAEMCLGRAAELHWDGVTEEVPFTALFLVDGMNTMVNRGGGSERA